MITTAIETESGRAVAHQVAMATSFLDRFRGLLGHKQLDDEAGLLLRPGGNVHTFGMRFALDLVFLDAQMRISKIARGVPPWRISLSPRHTSCVLELTSGRATTAGLHVGMRLIERVATCS
jgi:uncharacterized membrane protein (UPF0127 family)